MGENNHQVMLIQRIDDAVLDTVIRVTAHVFLYFDELILQLFTDESAAAGTVNHDLITLPDQRYRQL